MLIKLAVSVTKILLKYGPIIFIPPWEPGLNKTLHPSNVGSNCNQGIYVAPPVTELKSLKEVDMAQRKGAITKQAHSTTKKYFKNVYNLGILFSHQNLR